MGYSNKTYTCPFFIWDEREKIHCEAGQVSLPRKELVLFVQRHCASMEGWRTCSLAKAMERHYEQS